MTNLGTVLLRRTMLGAGLGAAGVVGFLGLAGGVAAQEEASQLNTTNREIIERWYAEQDPSLLAEDIGWDVLPTFPEGGTYTGKAAVLEDFFPRILARFESYAAAPERFVAEGDTVIALGHYEATGLNGATATSRFAHIWTVQDGLITSFDQVADTVAIRDALAP